MAKARGRDPKKEFFWRSHVRQQGASRLSVRAYCGEHGLSEAGFHWWRRELRRRDEQAGRTALSKALGHAFAQIKIVDEGRGSACSERIEAGEAQPGPTASGVELLVCPGRRVRVERDFDAATLLRVLAVLEGAGGC